VIVHSDDFAHHVYIELYAQAYVVSASGGIGLDCCMERLHSCFLSEISASSKQCSHPGTRLKAACEDVRVQVHWLRIQVI